VAVLLKDKSMQRMGVYHPNMVFTQLADTPIFGTGARQSHDWDLLGVESSVASYRIFTFHRSLTCECCGAQGNVFVVERHVNNKQKPHLSLYSVTPTGAVMLTVDHILPDCMGGKYHPSNFQTMCTPCNQGKKNIMSLAEINLVRANPKMYAKWWVNVTYLLLILDVLTMWWNATDPVHRTRLMYMFDKYRKHLNYNDQQQHAVEQFTVSLTAAIQSEYDRLLPAPKIYTVVLSALVRWVKTPLVWITSVVERMQYRLGSDEQRSC
jgi:hypothetical protein